MDYFKTNEADLERNQQKDLPTYCVLNQANKGKQFGLEKKKEKRTNYKYS